ncbi:MAG: Do family serine endopeptidase [Proteobacteria bacterium]|nr:Do family serine endopeptidase [Pseudomonadota bacterium]
MNRVVLIAAAALIGVAVAGYAITEDANGPAIAAAAPKAAPALPAIVPQSTTQMQLSFAPIVKKVSPAVVNVYARSVVQQQMNPMFADPMFQRFFGITPQMRQRVQQSLGSGVIVRSDGLILTNNHVIAGGQEIVVALADKREFKAKVVQADARLDLALLRVDTRGEKLPTVTFGDSDKAQVGDIVLAIGDPFGVGQTVTMGIVSALARTQSTSSDAVYIQTDAAINPGNSGGALVTSDGRLLGINSSIYSNSGGNIGIGFAIPSNLARRFVEGTASGGSFKMAWFGAEGQPVTSAIASSVGLSRPEGVILKSVYPDGPAAKAGLKVGDVVLAIDGNTVDDMQSLNYRITTHKPGDSPSLKVSSNGRVRDVSVTLTAPPETTPRATATIGGRNPLTGVKVENLSPAVALDLQMDASATGVVIVSVAPGTPAAGYGFQPGDIVRGLNGAEIHNVGELKSGLEASQGHWTLVVDRGGHRLSLSVNG